MAIPFPLQSGTFRLMLTLLWASAALGLNLKIGDSELTRKPSWNLGLGVAGGGLSSGTVFDLEPATYGLPPGAAGISARIIPASQLGDKFGYKITNASHYLHGITAADVKGAVVIASRGGGGYTGKTGACATVGAAACIVYDTVLPYGQVGMIGIAPPTNDPAYITSLDAGNAIEAAAANGTVVTATIAGSGPVAAGERAALEAVYDAMSKGDEWAFGAKFYGVYQLRGAGVEHWSWMKSHPGQDICSNGTRLWGVWCEGGSITMISGLQWQYQTKHSWSLPDAFGQLTGLKKLLFASLYGVGALPDTLSSMSSLVFLDISEQDFSGNLPCSMGGMTNLEYLQIRNNKFTGISSCVGGGSEGGTAHSGTKKLRFVWADGNMFNTLPASFTQLPNVVVFAMSGNKLSNLPAVSTMVAVKVFDVSSNSISTVMPSFAGLGQLTTLDLSGNKFSGSSHAAAFDNMAALQTLTLRDNMLSGPVPNFAGTESLVTLDAAKNNFAGGFPASWRKLVNITTLKMSENKLASPVDALVTLTKLTRIELSHNKLTTSTSETEKNGLGNWFLHASFPDSTEFLDISHNELDGLLCPETAGGGEVEKCTAKPGHFTNLETLKASHNPKLGGRFPEILLGQNGPKLKVCDFSDCDLEGPVPDPVDFSAPVTLIQFTNNKRMNWKHGSTPGTLPKWAKVTEKFTAASKESKYSCPQLSSKTRIGMRLEVSSSYYDNSFCRCNRGYYDKGESGVGALECANFPLAVPLMNLTSGTISDKFGAQSATHERLQMGMRTTYNVQPASGGPKSFFMTFTDVALKANDRISVYEGTGASGKVPVWSFTNGQTTAPPRQFHTLGSAATVVFFTESLNNTESFTVEYEAKSACPANISVASADSSCKRPFSKINQVMELAGFDGGSAQWDSAAFRAAVADAVARTASVPLAQLRIVNIDSAGVSGARRALSSSRLAVAYELWPTSASELVRFRQGVIAMSTNMTGFARQMVQSMASNAVAPPAAWSAPILPIVQAKALSMFQTCPPGSQFYSGKNPKAFCAANPSLPKATLGQTESCCTKCTAGRYQDTISNTQMCRKCQSGSFAATEGQATCTLCNTKGLATSEPTENMAACTCAGGFFTTGAAVVVAPLYCAPCPPGTYCPKTMPSVTFATMTTNPGFWQDLSFYAANDTAKKLAFKTETCRSTRSGSSMCAGGKYSMDASDNTTHCSKAQTLRAETAAKSCAQTTDASLCAGTPECIWHSSLGCAVDTTLFRCGCRYGHTGIACSSCIAGFNKNYWKECRQCDDHTTLAKRYGTFAGVVIGVFILIAGLCAAQIKGARKIGTGFQDKMKHAAKYAQQNVIMLSGQAAAARQGGDSAHFRQEQATGEEQAMRRQEQARAIYAQGKNRAREIQQEIEDGTLDGFGPAIQFVKDNVQVVVGLFQVLTQYIDIFDVSWPSFFTKVTLSFDWVNLDFMNFGCIPDTTFMDSFMLYFFAVIFIAALSLCIMISMAVIQKLGKFPRRTGKDGEHLHPLVYARHGGLKLLVTTLFLTYPAMCAKLVRMFQCTEMANGVRYLDADQAIVCSDSVIAHSYFFDWKWTYQQYRDLAWYLSVLFPIGVPVLFFLILFAHKKRMFSDDKYVRRETRAEIGFMYGHYKSRYWYWEVVDLLRKLLLTTILLSFYPKSPLQLVFGCIMAAAVLLLNAKASPLKEKSIDMMTCFCQISIFCTLFAALLMRMDVKSQGPGNWFVVDNMLTLFVLIPIIGLLVAVLSMIKDVIVKPTLALRKHDRDLKKAIATGELPPGTTLIPLDDKPADDGSSSDDEGESEQPKVIASPNLTAGVKIMV